MDETHKRLDRIEQLILEQTILKKEVLNLVEASIYTGLSKSHLYKLTSAKKIPHYKPSEKHIAFKRRELDDWLLRNPQKTTAEIVHLADDFIIKGGRDHGTD